uniref:apolipoprotein D-like n=1 Tax=Centroberyx gerrardi TaxID=166262 RepID=UPI003AAB0601
MKTVQLISLTLLSVLAASAQVILPGKCPRPDVQEDFDAARYLGTWYGIQKLPDVLQKGECSTATYSLRSPGVVGVLNRELLANGTINAITGSAKAKDPSEPAKLEVSFFESTPPAPYRVLSTDYDGYALIYSCTDYGLFHVDFAWIMSRQPSMLGQTIDYLHSILASAGVSVDKLLITNQDTTFCRAMVQ